ncbi:MAG TPA: DUF4390 domain-containing protein [Alcaligenes sp.]|nr:DUF4390 domain-containing protein [Alcaligenes sp.]
MRRVFLSFLLIFYCALTSAQDIVPVTASGERVVKVEPHIRDQKLYIDADIDFELSDELRNAAEKGVPLYFTAEVEVKEQQTGGVVYTALTRQWRVGTGDLSLPESSMNDALDMLRHIRGWSVAYVADLEHDQEYRGRLRLRLDTSLLARPFQVDAINSSAWSLATPWKTFSFSVSVAEPRP